MDSKVSKIRGARSLAALLPLLFCASNLKAVNLITATLKDFPMIASFLVPLPRVR